jgi:hypothetical protein
MGLANPQEPLPRPAAYAAVLRCVGRTARLAAGRRVHLRHGHLGHELRFADGTRAPVYRETVVDGVPPERPCVLVVEFRLVAVRGRAHALFRGESILHTPLFVGFPGFVSKLWLAHDQQGRYRGLYEWDGPERAEAYARALWRVLELVSARGSIHYQVLPGLRRDEVLADPTVLERFTAEGEAAWWRLVEAAA